MYRRWLGQEPPPAEAAASQPAPDAPSLPQRAPTLTFVIPFPEPPFSNSSNSIPPFLLYAPLAARFERPEPGQKESLPRMATRKWQEHEHQAREAVAAGDTSFRNKAVGAVSKAMNWTKNSRVEFLVRTPAASQLEEIRIIYPKSYPADNIKEQFTSVLRATKAAAIRNGIIATAILPIVFVIDAVTFIPGPFEINAVFAAASWTGASRATSISNGVTSEKVKLSFVSDDRLEHFRYHLHELCWKFRRPTMPMEKPKWHEKGAWEERNSAGEWDEQPEPETETLLKPEKENENELEEVDHDQSRQRRWKGEGYGPMKGIELAALTLALINAHVDLGADQEYERDLERVAEDIEQVFVKGAKEWLAAAAAH